MTNISASKQLEDGRRECTSDARRKKSIKRRWKQSQSVPYSSSSSSSSYCTLLTRDLMPLILFIDQFIEQQQQRQQQWINLSSFQITFQAAARRPQPITSVHKWIIFQQQQSNPSFAPSRHNNSKYWCRRLLGSPHLRRPLHMAPSIDCNQKKKKKSVVPPSRPTDRLFVSFRVFHYFSLIHRTKGWETRHQ